eukprot:TRINITY_DN4479_c1_g1_i2.p1 TRINITY_DN4479_c1_g1~~TRINITY_DN4479_c1_g1_i2.p1  ORF type:complete len:468 (-),score=64.55 TRINITY_DN4479_c1_g1_i2:2048-3451(-)
MFQPTLESLKSTLTHFPPQVHDGKQVVVPICKKFALDTFPIEVFLKIRRGNHSMIFELSEENDPTIRKYTIIATEPAQTYSFGPDHELRGDPVSFLQHQLLNKYQVHEKFKLEELSILNGSAFGYIGYDCIKYFEPRVARHSQEDVLKIPEAFFMVFYSYVVINHKSKEVTLVALCPVNGDVDLAYDATVSRINELHTRITDTKSFPYYNNDVVAKAPVSNLGQGGYQEIVKTLKKYIIDGYIIQAVPSQRLTRPTPIHPFNIYSKLRKVNPSRYGFYIEIGDFSIVGSSPELLVKVQEGRVINHPIAGTRKRGKTPEEDEALAKELLSDEKEISEHIQLVDLGRNDVNRICLPESTNVDSLMHIEKFSHVQHIVSQVSGKLRPECTPFDAFRSIFPAGTVSGAPKVQAMELIAQMEKEKRGVYAGAVGYFGFDGNIDTCIAIRTLVHKNGIAYLQAGGGKKLTRNI